MATEESDGVQEALAGAVRVALTSAGMAGERLARRRQEQLRRITLAAEDEARILGARFEAERALARAALSGIVAEDWWRSARPEQIADAWQTATAWRDHDRELARAHAQMAVQLSERYGIDSSTLTVRVGEADVQARIEAAIQRERAGRDDAEAAALLAAADREDRAGDPQAVDQQRALAQVHHATADEHAAIARELDEEAVQGAAIREASQGRPADQATRTPPRPGARARPSQGARRQRTRTRTRDASR
jgi:colicin import membrane protein